MALILERKPNQEIVIDSRITVRVIGFREGGAGLPARVILAVDAPSSVPIFRGELVSGWETKGGSE